MFFTARVFSPAECAGPKPEATIDPIPPTGAAVSTLTNELATAREALEAESSSRAELALQLRQSHEAVTDYEAEKAELIAAREKLSGESESLRKRIGALIAEQQTLRAELSKTSASDSNSLKNEVARLKKQIESERKNCEEAKAGLTAEIETLQKGIDQAIYGDQLKSVGDFPALDLPFLINDPIQLDRKFRSVFIELRGMKDSGEEMKAAYDKLTKDGKTSALHRIPFESGSAEVVASETKKRTELLKESPRGAKFLVVGYASTDGDAKSNYELSSKRASSFAAKLAGFEGIDKESVQAVYFGQTQRLRDGSEPHR